MAFDLQLTKCAGDATTLAKEIAGEVIVAVGGDGTVNEVANGLISSEKSLGIVPAGSGNDLIKSIGIPRSFPDALNILLKNRTRRIDVASVACSRSSELENGATSPSERYFLNGVGVGFDAAVADCTNRMKRLRGSIRYVLAVLRTLGKFQAPLFCISLDGEITESTNLLIAVGNGKCAGGGFWLTPDASVYDGWLDVCLVEAIPVHKILRLMPKVMRGAHTMEASVTMRRAKAIEISSSQRFYVHADGEIVGREVNEVKIRVHGKALRVVVGEMTGGDQ
jgi:YegS/Rv2252/BmrU family lipid kinase